MLNSNEERKVDTTLEITLGLIFAIPLSLYAGFTFSTLWGWFIVPFGAPHIGAIHSAGLLILLGLLRRNDKAQSVLTVIVNSLLISTLSLLAGLVFHALM